MRARRGAAFTLVILALALGAAACGGTTAKTTTSAAQAKAGEARWRAGLGHWRQSMLGALDGISVIFSTQATLTKLAARHSDASVRLAGFESTLANCTLALRRLGPAPRVFQLSHHYASQACKNLEHGARLVRQAVVRLVHNTLLDPLNPLTDATNPLGAGQSELTTAIRALDLPPT